RGFSPHAARIPGGSAHGTPALVRRPSEAVSDPGQEQVPFGRALPRALEDERLLDSLNSAIESEVGSQLVTNDNGAIRHRDGRARHEAPPANRPPLATPGRSVPARTYPTSVGAAVAPRTPWVQLLFRVDPPRLRLEGLRGENAPPLREISPERMRGSRSARSVR